MVYVDLISLVDSIIYYTAVIVEACTRTSAEIRLKSVGKQNEVPLGYITRPNRDPFSSRVRANNKPRPLLYVTISAFVFLSSRTILRMVLHLPLSHAINCAQAEFALRERDGMQFQNLFSLLFFKSCLLERSRFEIIMINIIARSFIKKSAEEKFKKAYSLSDSREQSLSCCKKKRILARKTRYILQKLLLPPFLFISLPSYTIIHILSLYIF